jgi:hypothetical protein
MPGGTATFPARPEMDFKDQHNTAVKGVLLWLRERYTGRLCWLA